MKTIKFPKGIDKLIFPIHHDIEGESTKTLRKFLETYKMPKKYGISWERKILVGHKYDYDITQITVNKD